MYPSQVPGLYHSGYVPLSGTRVIPPWVYTSLLRYVAPLRRVVPLLPVLWEKPLRRVVPLLPVNVVKPLRRVVPLLPVIWEEWA